MPLHVSVMWVSTVSSQFFISQITQITKSLEKLHEQKVRKCIHHTLREEKVKEIKDSWLHVNCPLLNWSHNLLMMDRHQLQYTPELSIIWCKSELFCQIIPWERIIIAHKSFYAFCFCSYVWWRIRPKGRVTESATPPSLNHFQSQAGMDAQMTQMNWSRTWPYGMCHQWEK